MAYVLISLHNYTTFRESSLLQYQTYSNFMETGHNNGVEQ